jgi:hypothetical protein
MSKFARAAYEADKQLRHRGLMPFGPGPDRFGLLEDVARYLGTTDPMEIGAGALLETSGHARAQEQLAFQVPA